jgi:opacity protein-like surface antigen
VPAPFFLPDTGGVLTPSSTNLNGWNASVEGKLFPLVGIVADVSGHYGSQTVTDECGNIAGCVPVQDHMNAHMYNFLVGPQISFSIARVRPFAHALFGGGHLSESTSTQPFSASDTAFAYALGGGIDYRLAGPLRWRVQGDFLENQFFGKTQNNFRFSTGVVLHF